MPNPFVFTSLQNRDLKRSLALLLCGLCIFFAGCDSRSLLKDDFEAAQEAVMQQDWPQAARLIQRYLRMEVDPEKRWAAWLILLDASDNMGESSWVVDYMETMLLEYGNDILRSGMVLRQLGTIYENIRQWDKATAVWNTLLTTEEIPPGEAATIYRRMGFMHQREHRFALAREMFQLCAQYGEPSEMLGECLYYVADTYVAENDLEAAMAQLEILLNVADVPDPVKGMAYLLQGDIFEQQEQLEEAKSAMIRALQLHPNPRAVQTRLNALP